MAVHVIDTIKPKNNLNFPVVEAIDVKVSDTLRLDEALENNADDLAALAATVSDKADTADLTALEAEVDAKADSSDLSTAAANLQAQIDNLVTPVTQDAEVQNARVGADGTSYQTLKARLDSDSAAINSIMQIEKENILSRASTYDYYISSSGQLNNSASWIAYSYVVDFENDYKYEFECYTNNISYYSVGFYSSAVPDNNTFLGGVNLTAANLKSKISVLVDDLPAGTRSILFCTRTASGTDQTLVRCISGITSALKTNEKNIDGLIADFCTVGDISEFAYNTTNNLVQANGELSISANWKALWFNTTELKSIQKVKSYSTVTTYKQVAFYNSLTPSAATFINGYPFTSDSTYTITEDISIPTDAKLAIITNRDKTNPEYEINGTINKTKEDIQFLDSAICTTGDLVDHAYKKTENYIQSSGNLSQSNKWDAYWFKCSLLKKIKKVKTYSNKTEYKQIGFYSTFEPSNDTYISGYSFASDSAASTIENISVPDNAVLALITNRKLSGTDIEIKGTIATDVKAMEAITISLKKSYSVWDKFDSKFNLIAYSKVNNPYNYLINTVENYRYAGQQGYDGIKGDLRITSDDELVMCHDAGFTLDGNGKIITFDSTNYTPIRNMTLAEVKELVFAQQTTSGDDMHVPTFAEYVRECKRSGCFCYPTLRDEYMSTIVPIVLDTLDKYGIRNNTMINSMTLSTLQQLREIDTNIPVTYTKDIRSSNLSTSDIDDTAALGNSAFGYYAINGAGTTVQALINHIEADTSAIAYAKENGVRLYAAISAQQHLDILLDSGFYGTHSVDIW